MRAAAYVVVTRGATFGPFPTVREAETWASHPDRTADVRPAWVVVPLFGGALLQDDATTVASGDDEPEPVSRCPACGEPIDYCQGHGEIGDPEGFMALELHDNDVHTHCHPYCEARS